MPFGPVVRFPGTDVEDVMLEKETVLVGFMGGFREM